MKHTLSAVLLGGWVILGGQVGEQMVGAAEAGTARPADAIQRLQAEGTNRSQVMQWASYLTDVIGPRLTGSPNLKRAHEWTRDTMTGWGLTNAHLEAWGPFGYGWSLKRFSAQVTEPQCIPLIAVPRAWSPGLERPLAAEVVYLGDVTNRTELEKHQGKLKGAIVMLSTPVEFQGNFEPVSVRHTETNLLRLANAGSGSSGRGVRVRPPMARATPTNAPVRPALSPKAAEAPPAAAPRPERRPAETVSSETKLAFCAREGAALIVSASRQGEAGVVGIAQASVPGPYPANREGFFAGARVAPWATNAPKIPAQIVLAAEHYGQLVRQMRLGGKVRMEVDFQVQFHTNDLMGANTLAELPGTDLKEQVVMLGAHLDSWHIGSGAVDNAVGAAVCMEAVRLIKATGLQPRRTIRVGLWGGEEEGLLGSRAYVQQHFASYSNFVVSNLVVRTSSNWPPRELEFRPARTRTNSAPTTTTNLTTTTRRTLVRLPDYERFSAYFNIDNGAGRFRGIYLQGNEALRPLFRRWLEPFRTQGAETISAANTFGTDHLSFTAVGLPGFQFIQDWLDYNTRSRHTNMDVYERILPEDAQQAAVIMAAFVYEAAMQDERLPRVAPPE